MNKTNAHFSEKSDASAFSQEAVKKIIGLRIMLRRKHLGISQKELASLSGISDNQVSNIENGICFPRMNTLLSFCRILDVSPDYFIIGAIHRKFDKDILDMVAFCSPDEQKTIWLLVNTYIHRKDEEFL